MRAVAMQQDDQLAAWRRGARKDFAEALEQVLAALATARDDASLWADAVSHVVEKEAGISAADEHQVARISQPEYAATLIMYGRLSDAHAAVDKLLADLRALACPACTTSTADTRQQPDGSLVCARCGRATLGPL